jgi:phosphoglycolate phosphatase-like HAD superfamily hydrolase
VAKLILFDIDGTLVLTGGAGARAMARACAEVFGVDNGFGSIPMAGRTDAWIVAQFAQSHGLVCDAVALRHFHDCYIDHLTREVNAPGPRKGVLPGVRPLLDTLASQDAAYLALLTGNFERGAQIKLQHFKLWDYFGAGAFGDDAHDRNGLFGTALARVEAAGGPAVHPSDVVIVGDTPLDIAVAVAGGARSIGVATGSYSESDLRASGADVVFADLSNLAAVLAALERLA